MNCAHESELLDTVLAGRWPDGCDELRAHVESCAVCGELAKMVLLFHYEMQSAAREAHLPASGLAWWRAQRRARAEAARKASRAFTVVQTVSIAGAIAFALVVLGGLSVMNDTWQTWAPRFDEVIALVGYSRWTATLMIAGLTFLTLTPVALYFALAED